MVYYQCAEKTKTKNQLFTQKDTDICLGGETNLKLLLELFMETGMNFPGGLEWEQQYQGQCSSHPAHRWAFLITAIKE